MRTPGPTAGDEPTSPRGPDHGVFAISIAAELTGLAPATMRIYEREGLLLPARSEGGTRRYSADDIHRLHRIAELMAGGMNIVGVREVLRLQGEINRLTNEVEALRPRQSSRVGGKDGGPGDED
jgi:MerR family transcriptional regulator/heat shock protein HspR